MNWIPTAKGGRGILELVERPQHDAALFIPTAKVGRCGAGGAAPRKKVKMVTSTGKHKIRRMQKPPIGAIQLLESSQQIIHRLIVPMGDFIMAWQAPFSLGSKCAPCL